MALLAIVVVRSIVIVRTRSTPRCPIGYPRPKRRGTITDLEFPERDEPNFKRPSAVTATSNPRAGAEHPPSPQPRTLARAGKSKTSRPSVSANPGSGHRTEFPSSPSPGRNTTLAVTQQRLTEFVQNRFRRVIFPVHPVLLVSHRVFIPAARHNPALRTRLKSRSKKSLATRRPAINDARQRRLPPA